MIPILDKIIVKQDEKENKTKSGIILHDVDKPNRGKVVAVGEKRLDDGSYVRLTIDVGDTVIFSGYAGTKFKLNDEEYIVLREEDILVKGI
jgi:chaperonin GroES